MGMIRQKRPTRQPDIPQQIFVAPFTGLPRRAISPGIYAWDWNPSPTPLFIPAPKGLRIVAGGVSPRSATSRNKSPGGATEHSGSVASLEDWFDPKRLRDDYAPSGWKGPGVKTRAVPGHKFGHDLAGDDKKALIAFLKTL